MMAVAKRNLWVTLCCQDSEIKEVLKHWGCGKDGRGIKLKQNFSEEIV
jgi:hypothetical protein